MTGYLTCSRLSRTAASMNCAYPIKRCARFTWIRSWTGLRTKRVLKVKSWLGCTRRLRRADADMIKEYLDEQLLDTVSYYDAHESFYHGFLLALLSTCANWRVSSNIETGKGRSDVVVERKDRKIGFVVEVKDVKDYEKLDATCDAAMKQIEARDYTAILRRYRVKTIWTYGIAFWEKECKVVVKRVG